MEVVASLSQGRTASAQCGLFTYKSVPVIFEPPCITIIMQKVSGASEQNLVAQATTRPGFVHSSPNAFLEAFCKCSQCYK